MRSLLERALLCLAAVSVSSAGCVAAVEDGDEEGQVDEASEENVATQEEATAACADITEMEHKTKDCPVPIPDAECTRPCVTDRYLVQLPPTPTGPVTECRSGLRTCEPWACTLCR